jgi:site-specific DNA recombinase
VRQIRPERVAIYVRWSTDDQSEGTTLDVQLEGCRHYALSQGWQPTESLTFIDDGYSGGNLMRPALTRLRGLIRAGEVDCVVVFKVDRLSRNIVDAVELVLNEWRERCFFKSAREPIDTSSDLGRVIFGILAMFADFERSQIRERTQSGKVRRIAEGKQLHGEPAFGYQPSGARGQWAERPDEAKLVRRLFRMAAGGESVAAICRQLNTEGVRTRAGGAWSLRSVLWILRNRLYIGEVVYGRTQLKLSQAPGDLRKTQRIRREEPLVATATEAAPPLVEPELFQRAQAQLDRRKTVRAEHGARSLSSPYLLVGLARCRCGGTLVAKRQRHGAAYICHNARAGRCGHDPGYIEQVQADAVILAQFLALHGAAAAEPARVAQAAVRLDADLGALAAQRAALERAVAGLQGQEERLLRAVRTGELDPRDLRDLRAGLERERAELAERLAGLDREMDRARCRAQRIQEAMGRLGRAPRIDRLGTPQQRELLRAALAGPVVLFKAKGSDRIEAEAAWQSPEERTSP